MYVLLVTITSKTCRWSIVRCRGQVIKMVVWIDIGCHHITFLAWHRLQTIIKLKVLRVMVVFSVRYVFSLFSHFS